MATTQVTWSDTQTSSFDEIADKAFEMQAQGKTDGNWQKNTNEDGNSTVERTWTDVPAAQEWIDFVNQFNPLSATIKDES